MNRIQAYWPLLASPLYTFKLKEIYNISDSSCLVETQVYYDSDQFNNYPFPIVREKNDFCNFYLCIKNGILTINLILTMRTVKALINAYLRDYPYKNLYLLLTFKRNDGAILVQRQDVDAKITDENINGLYFGIMKPINLEENISYFDVTHTYKFSVEFYLF